MEKILIDSNIVIEILGERAKSEDCKNILFDNQELNNTICLSSSSLPIIFHHAQSLGTVEGFKEFLDSEIEVIYSDKKDFDKALEIFGGNGYDFEDALQIACCLNNDITTFITLDKNLKKRFSRFQKIKLVG